MKIGFSFGRCIRDIVNGEVGYDDVAWIISGTALRDAETVKFCIQDYSLLTEHMLVRFHKLPRCFLFPID